jgi:hypothetical protein
MFTALTYEVQKAISEERLQNAARAQHQALPPHPSRMWQAATRVRRARQMRLRGAIRLLGEVRS